MAKLPQYYWDACAWIALIKREAVRVAALEYAIWRAQRGEIALWTSTFTLAEVFKKQCGGEHDGIAPIEDDIFADFVQQDFVHLVQVDLDVAHVARSLLRRFPELKKPQDAIHAATALLSDVDELHTFDGCNLLALDGKLPKRDGASFLKICKPPEKPDPDAGTLLAGLKP